MDNLNLETELHSIVIDEVRMVEVHRSDVGEHWVGMTFLCGPKDWEFHPREQYGLGEVGERMAIDAAERWARGIKFDMTR